MEGQLAGLKIECWGKEKGGKVCVGTVFIPQSELPLNGDSEAWYQFIPHERGSLESVSAPRGELYLRLWYQSVRAPIYWRLRKLPHAKLQVPLSPIKEITRRGLRKRSSSLLKRKGRKDLEKVFPLAPDELLLRSTCLLSPSLAKEHSKKSFYEQKSNAHLVRTKASSTLLRTT